MANDPRREPGRSHESDSELLEVLREMLSEPEQESGKACLLDDLAREMISEELRMELINHGEGLVPFPLILEDSVAEIFLLRSRLDRQDPAPAPSWSGKQAFRRRQAELEFSRDRWELSRRKILFFCELGMLGWLLVIGVIVLFKGQPPILQLGAITALGAIARFAARHLTRSG